MKTLLILRHGKSSRDDPDLDDHERPLNKRGRADSPRMGRLLRRHHLVPDAILCSTASRALHTADLVARAAGFDGEIERDRKLYLAAAPEIVARLAALEDRVAVAMVVGHNPGLDDLVEALTGKREHLPTAAIARVSLPVERWRDTTPGTRGKLVDLWRPKDLG